MSVNRISLITLLYPPTNQPAGRINYARLNCTPTDTQLATLLPALLNVVAKEARVVFVPNNKDQYTDGSEIWISPPVRGHIKMEVWVIPRSRPPGSIDIDVKIQIRNHRDNYALRDRLQSELEMAGLIEGDDFADD